MTHAHVPASASVPSTIHAARSGRLALGPRLWLGAAAIALVVTALAASLTPGLARPDSAGYLVSGVFMTSADLLLLAGVVALVRTDIVPSGRWWSVARFLAVVGSAASVGAELLLRVDFSAGTIAFSVAGPAQAAGFIGIGVGVVARHHWQSWHRYAVLALGLYVPVVLVPAIAASGGQSLLALGGFHALVLLVGIAWSLQQPPRSRYAVLGPHAGPATSGWKAGTRRRSRPTLDSLPADGRDRTLG